ncbi:hypothetical protein BKN38_02090 [Helicobacter sp. CLO-3]|nr:hypothetical protein BA723_01400 [Helicobacter sp. CLO-3]OHU84853.1 hypothetical protein BKN38_02090 [Helicobacter sp. CLO-3]
MGEMFVGAKSFDQNLDAWDTRSFDQNLDAWDTRNLDALATHNARMQIYDSPIFLDSPLESKPPKWYKEWQDKLNNQTEWWHKEWQDQLNKQK